MFSIVCRLTDMLLNRKCPSSVLFLPFNAKWSKPQAGALQQCRMKKAEAFHTKPLEAALSEGPTVVLRPHGIRGPVGLRVHRCRVPSARACGHRCQQGWSRTKRTPPGTNPSPLRNPGLSNWSASWRNRSVRTRGAVGARLGAPRRRISAAADLLPTLG